MVIFEFSLIGVIMVRFLCWMNKDVIIIVYILGNLFENLKWCLIFYDI